jgi:predicted phage-related endonuclease
MTTKKTIDISALDNTSTEALIDELGNLQAAIKQLEDRETKLNAAIKSRVSADSEYSGDHFIAIKTAVSSTKLDTKKAKAFIELNVDAEFQKEFFTTSSSERLNIKVRPVWADAAE